MSKVSLGIIGNTRFRDLYQKLLKDEELNTNEKASLLEIAVLFLNDSDGDIQKLGYRIILQYSNHSKDYTPLYDTALNLGYIPIAKVIENMPGNRELFESTFFKSFLSSFKENFNQNDMYLTLQQLELTDFFKKTRNQTVAIVAPTSYGKSELIHAAGSESVNLCVLVPTKALLAQTKRRILNAKEYSRNRKIITHPEMYIDGDKNFIAILTQERLLRLLQKDRSLTFGLVYVDEAHNLLEDDVRTRLLAQCLIVLGKRNPQTIFKFLSPFLIDTNNLRVRHTAYSIEDFTIDETVKIERFHYCDFRNQAGKLYIYDQFLNIGIPTRDGTYENDIELILDKRAGKNLVYLNRPLHIQEFAEKLRRKLEPVQSDILDKARKDISDYLHKDYSIVKCLKYGVVYHHGSVPDTIRLYLEYLYTIEPRLSFIVTSSTLLEGVNIPAERLFMLDCRKGLGYLSPSQFKNLVGRVCRFKEVFDINAANLIMLEPQVYIVGSDYIGKRANIQNFLKVSAKAGKKIVDKPENVLLVEAKKSDKKERAEAEEFIENVEPGTIAANGIKTASTLVGQRCFANNITEINIIENEGTLQLAIEHAMSEGWRARSPEDAIDLINTIFLEYIKADRKFDKLRRLRREEARNFYSMILKWRLDGASYGEMISTFLKYWQGRVRGDALVYVGRWGDKTWRDSHRTHWVDIREKTKIERVNLAIVRIKEEQDFIDNNLRKFIEVLNDFNLLEEDLYNKIKYGTSNDRIIIMIKNGLSSSLATLLFERYSNFIRIDDKSGVLEINPDVVGEMNSNDENGILVFEAGLNIREPSSLVP